jgi:hypothetical protein
MRPLLRLLLVLPLLALLAPGAARAQGVYGGVNVYAYTEVGAAVRLRDVSVQARLEKGVARTDTTLIFEHELKDAAQMTVNLTVSKDTVVTGYSYWFKGEQIDAKLLDNDQAWEIYHAVTSRGRDPAIMEQWGETDYHFQIYPVEPGKELKMVIHTVAPWEGDAEGFYYRPPFPTAGAPLKSYEAEVRLPGLGGERLRDNFIGQFRMESDGPVYRLERSDWMPDRDWRIRIGGAPEGLALRGSGGRSGGRDGFFYLLLAPGRQIGPARLRLSGVRTWAVMPLATGGLGKGFPWLVAGRYRGSGVLNVALKPRRGPALRASLRLTDASIPNGPATKFWATRYLKKVCNGSDAHAVSGTGPSSRRTLAVRTSQRFGVVSPYTAWLAIPKSELEFYRKLQSDPEFKAQVQANRARTNAQAARGGDPLIRIETTPDVQRVTAVLPTGEAIPMVRKRGNTWEGRFDIPWGTAEGVFEVVVLLQSEDGSRKSVTLSYTIDRTRGTGQARVVDGVVRVTVSADVVRVVVRGAAGERLELERGADGVFIGRADGLGAGPLEITLIDRAHNITVLGLEP